MICKHKWDFIRVETIGNNPIMMLRDKVALWICPYCNKRKRLIIEVNSK